MYAYSYHFYSTQYRNPSQRRIAYIFVIKGDDLAERVSDLQNTSSNKNIRSTIIRVYKAI